MISIIVINIIECTIVKHWDIFRHSCEILLMTFLVAIDDCIKSQGTCSPHCRGQSPIYFHTLIGIAHNQTLFA